MHRVWLGVDSGLPVRKQTRHDVVSCKMSILAFPRAKFSTRVDLDREAPRSFRPTPRKNIWPNFVRSYSVRTWHTGLLLRSLVNAPCLHSSRFGRPRREAHAVSCQRSTHGIMSDFAKGRFGSSPVRNFPLESIWIFRPLGFFRPTPRKSFWSNLVLSYLSGVRTLAYRT